MAWTKNKSKHVDGILAGEFLTNLLAATSTSQRKVATILSVNEKSVRRWLSNQRHISQSKLELLIDKLFPGVWSRQPNLRDSEIGPTTWVAGVGQATLRAASTGHW